MATLAIAQPLWKGREATAAQGPGGAGLEFSATKEAVEKLNARVDEQMTDLNKRLYDLDPPSSRPLTRPPKARSRFVHLESPSEGGTWDGTRRGVARRGEVGGFAPLRGICAEERAVGSQGQEVDQQDRQSRQV